MAADILERILAVKREEVAAARAAMSAARLAERIAAAPPVRGFAAAMRANYSRGGTAVDAPTGVDATTHPAHGRYAPACGGSPSAARARHGGTAIVPPTARVATTHRGQAPKRCVL